MERIEYTTVDKSEWDRGEWDSEPDKIQWQDEETGLPCLINRGPITGALCGYVGVPKGHPAFGSHYDSVNVEVHGGLTYSDKCMAGPEDRVICHVPGPNESDDVWWLGFDCGHFMDVMPRMVSELKAIGCRPELRFEDNEFFRESYKNIAYVTEEVKELAKQLKAMA